MSSKQLAYTGTDGVTLRKLLAIGLGLVLVGGAYVLGVALERRRNR